MLNALGPQGQASRPTTPRPVEFFRHHGVWAPGVRLFRRMRFAANAGIVSAVFLIPVVTLGISVFSDKADAIAFASKERDGVSYLREATPLLQLAQRQRLAAEPALHDEIDARLARLRAVDDRLGSGLKAHDAFRAVAQAASGPAGQQARQDFARSVSALIDLVTDNSNLGLDPGLDTVYLMNTVVTNLPTVVDNLVTQVLLSSGEPTAERRNAYLTAQALGELSSTRMKSELGKVYSVHPADAAKFGDERVREKAQVLRQRAPEASVDAKQLAPQAAEALAGLWLLQAQLTDRLDELLAARVDEMKLWRDATAALVAISLLLAAYLFYAFFLVMQGGLREVEKHLRAMTIGDLTTQPQPWGRDEAARLLVTLAEMQASLRGIVSKVRHSSTAIVQASTEIAASSSNLAQRTEQTAANLEESATSMDAISATARQTADHSQHAAVAAVENAKAARQGGSMIGQVVETMRDIHASSAKIGEIIGTIDGIAFQTNILALNAAVEAARAGEQGRGFAVVASEVRSLAQRSAAAARQVKTLITDSTACVDSGARTVGLAGDSMGRLLDTAQQTNTLLAEISTAAAEQSAGVSKVGSALNKLEAMTQQNAALVEQSTAAAAALHGQAEHLVSEVAHFRLPA